VTWPRGVDDVGQFWKVVREGVWYCNEAKNHGDRCSASRRMKKEPEREGQARKEGGGAGGGEGRTSLSESFFSVEAAARIWPSGLNLREETAVVMLLKDLSCLGGWKTELEEDAGPEYMEEESVEADSVVE
jgi:hypothetical protein